MKNKLVKLYALAAVGLMFSCSDSFFEKTPQDSLDESKIDKTKIQSMRNNLYNQMPWGCGDAPGVDGCVDNAYVRNSWDGYGGAIQKNTITAEDNVAYSYGGIRICNLFIDLANIIDIDEATRTKYVAEGRVMRAWEHADLTLYYGDIAVVTAVANDFPDGIARTPKADVRKWILQEFDEAIADLPETNDDRTKFNKATATALKARYAYYFGEYTQARDAAKYVIDNGGYSLLSASVDKQNGLGDDLDFFAKLVDFDAMKVDRAAFLQGIANYWSLWHTEAGANPEAIISREFVANENNGDWTRFAFMAPSALTNYYGWTCVAPIQPLVDAYWNADGSQFVNTVSDRVSAYGEIDALVRADDRPASDAIASLDASGQLVNFDFMKQFKNRDARMYASIIFPYSSAKSFMPGKYWNYLPEVANDGESGFGFRKITGSERTDEFMVLWGAYPMSGADYPVLRLAEILLIYAESQTQVVGYDGTVVAQLNKLRDRVGMPHVPASLSKTDGIEFIRKERRIELAGEGLRYFDIRLYEDSERNGGVKGSQAASVVMATQSAKDVSGRLNSYELTWDSRLMYMPIPTTAMDRNQLLTQNEGY